MSFKTISPQELNDIRSGGREFDLIDVRTPVEYQAVYTAASRNVPLDGLIKSDVVVEHLQRPGPLYVICQSGARGRQACEWLIAAGLTSVVNVEGGITAWMASGLPVIRGRQGVSLERQVRIAAGSLVVIGVLLGWLLHPVFFGMTGLIGAGLVFAGITDTCGMGLLLSRMPWNHVAHTNPSGANELGTGMPSPHAIRGA